MLIDRALALIGLRRIKRNVHVRIVGNAEDYRGIAEAMRRVALTQRDRGWGETPKG